MKYKHLSYSDRQEMEKLYLQGWHMNDIAAKLGVSLATVYHERARGDTGQMDKNGRGGYSAELAQSKIYARRKELQEYKLGNLCLTGIAKTAGLPARWKSPTP